MMALLLAGATGRLSVTATPSFLSSRGSSAQGTSSQVTAIPSGGSGNYAYAWSIVDGVGRASAPSSAATRFTLSDYAIARCTVTDISTGSTATVDVEVDYYGTGNTHQ